MSKFQPCFMLRSRNTRGKSLSLPLLLALFFFSSSTLAEYIYDLFGTGSHLEHIDDFQTSDEARQACVKFAQSFGANACNNGGSPAHWEAGWYRYGGAETFHLAIYYYKKCTYPMEFNDSTGECRAAEQKGPPPPLSCVGDPINVANGNSFQMETDYQSSGKSTLKFTRLYNGLDGLWRHNYATHLRISSTSILLVMADGRESFFTVDGSTVTAAPSEFGKLLKTTDGWLYNADNNERFYFDTTGRLVRWTTPFGAEHLLTYFNGTVTVTDNFGQSLSYTEDIQHQPLTLSTATLTIKYDYNINRSLIKLTRTSGGQTEQRKFHYSLKNTGLLTGITDERGVRVATWTFDVMGRATSSELAGGADRTQVAYNSDGSSTVTNALGKRTIYRFATIEGIKRVIAVEGEPSPNCPNSNSTFTYDERGLLKTKTDNRGLVTTYDYNARGLEISRTEAAGTPQARTITTDWHPTLFLPLSVTERHRITTYQYDAEGRQLGQTVTER